MDEEFELPSAQCCDDCISAQSVYWCAADGLKRCNSCFKLYVSIITVNPPDPALVAEYDSLLGVSLR